MPTPKRPRGRPKGSKNKGAAKTRVRPAGGPLALTAAVGGLVFSSFSAPASGIWVVMGLGPPRTVGKSGVGFLVCRGKLGGRSKGATPPWAETVTFSAGGPLAPAGTRREARFTVASAFQRSCFVFYFIFSKTRLISS